MRRHAARFFFCRTVEDRVALVPGRARNLLHAAQGAGCGIIRSLLHVVDGGAFGRGCADVLERRRLVVVVDVERPLPRAIRPGPAALLVALTFHAPLIPRQGEWV